MSTWSEKQIREAYCRRVESQKPSAELLLKTRRAMEAAACPGKSGFFSRRPALRAVATLAAVFVFIAGGFILLQRFSRDEVSRSFARKPAPAAGADGSSSTIPEVPAEFRPGFMEAEEKQVETKTAPKAKSPETPKSAEAPEAEQFDTPLENAGEGTLASPPNGVSTGAKDLDSCSAESAEPGSSCEEKRALAEDLDADEEDFSLFAAPETVSLESDEIIEDLDGSAESPQVLLVALNRRMDDRAYGQISERIVTSLRQAGLELAPTLQIIFDKSPAFQRNDFRLGLIQTLNRSYHQAFTQADNSEVLYLFIHSAKMDEQQEKLSFKVSIRMAGVVLDQFEVTVEQVDGIWKEIGHSIPGVCEDC